MKLVLLSGGRGRRLWPASTDEIPKQFLKVHDDNTMIENVFNNLQISYDVNDIYISTNNEYKEILKEILPNFNNYIIEPESNGTYSAILNVTAHLKYNEKISGSEFICFLPIDSDVENDFFKIFKDIEQEHENNSFIYLIGIKPNSISCNYGYIIHDDEKVVGFKEKPSYEEAIELINKGALWNSGIVIAQLDKFHTFLINYNIENYEEFINKYFDIPSGSFDVNVLENEDNLKVKISNCKWSDIGSWETLSPIISTSDKFNTDIINFEKKKIINDGVRNIILINTINGIRLLNKNNIFVEKWGYYEFYHCNNNNVKIKKIFIFPNRNISYHYHKYRNEELIVLNGTGKIISNEKLKRINSGDKVSITIGSRHAIKAFTQLEIIEIQYGNLCDEEDTLNLEENWNLIINKYIKEMK